MRSASPLGRDWERGQLSPGGHLVPRDFSHPQAHDAFLGQSYAMTKALQN